LTKIYIFFFSILFSSLVYSSNVAVIDINFIIDNSRHFKEISEKINDSQLSFIDEFKKIEENLYKKKEELENSKFVLNDDEFSLKKDEYYNEVSNYENNVSVFNSHYEKQIINVKNILFQKITELIQTYASANQIDLILEKNQYLIAADKINISEIIFIQLNEEIIELTFDKYEN